MEHHHSILIIYWSGIYCMRSWYATYTDPIPKLHIWIRLILWNVMSTIFFSIYCRIHSLWDSTCHCQLQLKYKDYTQAHLDMFCHSSSLPLLLLLTLRPIFLALYFLLNNFLRNTSSMCPIHTMQQFIFCICNLE